MNQRVELVEKEDLCSLCLRKGHEVEGCRSTLKCTLGNCGGRHHWLLHGASARKSVANVTVGEASKESDDVSQPIGCVPVEVEYDGKRALTWALMDSGAQCSILSRRIADALQVKSDDHSTEVQGITGSVLME